MRRPQDSRPFLVVATVLLSLAIAGCTAVIVSSGTTASVVVTSNAIDTPKAPAKDATKETTP